MNNTLWSLFPKESREANISTKTIVYVNKVPIISQTLNLALPTTYVNYLSKNTIWYIFLLSSPDK